MVKDRSESTSKDEKDEENHRKRNHKSKSKRKKYDSSSSSDYDSSDSEDEEKHRKRKKRSHKRSSKYEDSESSDSESELEESESESEAARRERKRRRREKEEKRRKERRREKDKKKKKKSEKIKKRKKEEKGKKGAVTDSWGKYGIIKETDMWNKRPEFTAWLAEVKKVNLETLPNWEEKQMFKEFMEDHNTATFPSKKYYNLDAYHGRKMEKEMIKGLKNVASKERTVFNDEEQRRLELQRERERQKEEEIEALKRSMQGGMAQAMKEQARLREEMTYQYRLGNFEAAAAIQRRLDPDVAM